jgi:hypothetical protein
MIKYIVNKEKRTVVAIIKLTDEYEESLPTFRNSHYIFDNLWSALKDITHNKADFWGREYHTKSGKMYFPKYMSAKAKCSPDDEWDEEFGKELARKRLVEKIHNYRSNSYKIIADMIKEISDSFID